MFGIRKCKRQTGILRAFLNSGYRRGGKSYRCSISSKKIEPEEFDAFACVAVAGLRDLPDTLASRCIIVRMKRRAPDEQVEAVPAIATILPRPLPIKEALEEWCEAHEAELDYRRRAGTCRKVSRIGPRDLGAFGRHCRRCRGRLAKASRKAAVYLTDRAADETLTKGVELLAHIHDAFAGDDNIATDTLIDRLVRQRRVTLERYYGESRLIPGLGQPPQGLRHQV